MDKIEKQSPKWKTPDEVMRDHRLKKKLNRRMTERSQAPLSFSSCTSNSEDSLMEFPVIKRKAPSLLSDREVKRRGESTADESGVEDMSSNSLSTERTLFNVLGGSRVPNSPKTPTSFSNLLKRLEPVQGISSDDSEPLSQSEAKPVKRIPIDWSLKSKLRFMSAQPFPWSGTMRTCEQVSAVTGFVRCLDPNRSKGAEVDLDTSSNSQFHRCCFYWMHPHLPWLPIFSRTNKLSPTIIAAQLQIAEALHQEWTLAFKSLLQLVKTQQCPYFYIIGTQFHCLFRAAGMAGQTEVNALISPTTRGFRKMLQDEDINYTMPLRKKNDLNSSGSSCSQQSVAEDEDDADDVDDLMDNDQVRKLTHAQKAKDRRNESRFDGSGESLVMVKGADIQALFNLLVNCKNNMDRLPPTLVAPTAFQLATLQSCHVRDSVVRVDGMQLHSIQVEGPIMPHALSQMCLLLDEANIEYSAAIATVKQTSSFSSVHADLDNEGAVPTMFFLKEYLSDCGLSKRVLSRLCESDPTQFGVIESIEPQQSL